MTKSLVNFTTTINCFELGFDLLLFYNEEFDPGSG